MEQKNINNKIFAIPEKIINAMIKDGKVRKGITKANFFMFFHFYFSHYIQYQTANFQKRIISYLDINNDDLFVVAFRGSGKSTIVTTAYPIWSILGKQQKKFVIIFCQTKIQAKQHMMNLRTELENNEILKNDLGPFKEESLEWGSQSLVFSKINARITIASTEQSIRGLRHNQNRPDLLILDDIEDIASTKTRETRDKTYRWLKSEVIPAGDKNTRLIMVGNLLHEDSLLMRVKEEIEDKKINGKFMFFPLLDEKDNCLWKGKYPTKKDIILEKKKIGNEISWKREFLLEIVPDVDQVIHKEWISYYDEADFPEVKEIEDILISIDPAISKKESADYTAIIAGAVTIREGEYKLYILPNPVNKRLTFPETFNICKELHDFYLKEYKCDPLFLIEDVAYQKSLVQMLEDESFYAVGVPQKSDKRMNLALVGSLLQRKKILFPKKGCEKIIEQILNFGIEKHDDLADAFSIIAIGSIHNRPNNFKIL